MAALIQKKCPHCGTWNKDEEHCTNCGKLIDPIKLREQERLEQQKQRILLRKPTQVDLWFERFSNSKNPLVRALYCILYSIWMVFAAIIGFILYLIALTPG